ncbi:hypothetical protein ACES2I_13190 [Bdellovibrio bacteriovorus]|uniref:hypothetical protein n=1 Tax=Bdellovibrio bacteriovorus TaxID=959 RepID=UPI0035A68396
MNILVRSAKLLLIFLPAFMGAVGCTLKADLLQKNLSTLPSTETPDAGDGNGEDDNDLSGYFPVDKTIPFFQDDFNRDNELLASNIKWIDLGGAPTRLTNKELSTSDNSGQLLVSPNNPAVFPDQPKVYLESSVVFDSSSDQIFGITPAADMGNMNIVGCFYRYTAATQTLSIYAGDFMSFYGGALTPYLTLTNYPVESANYLGCEVDEVAGTATVFHNLIELGTASVVVPPSASAVPMIIALGSIVVDNVKAFPSFEVGRDPNGDSKLKIYNPPYQKHYLSNLANFVLQGYCADDGATIQVKDSPPGTFQSGPVTCAGNKFSIPLDLSDVTRFPEGTNQIRIEYTVGGVSSEYFWHFIHAPIPPPPAVSIAIGAPSPSSGSSTTEFEWSVTYQNASAISLSSSDITLSGSTAGCVVSIVNSGPSSRTVKVTGCSAGTGSVAISLKAGTAVNSVAVPAGPQGPSAAALLRPSISIGTPTPDHGGNGITEFVWPITYTGASTVSLSSADVFLVGTASKTGCSVSIAGSGTVNRQVKVSGCQATSGTLAIVITAGTAQGSNGTSAPASATSPSVTMMVPLSIRTFAPYETSAGARKGYRFQIVFDGATAATLDPTDVVLAGATADCVVEVEAYDFTTYQLGYINLWDCSSLAYGAAVTISVKEGVATNSYGDLSPALPNATVIVLDNQIEVSFAKAVDVIPGGATTNTHQLMLALDRPSPVDVLVEYTVSPFFTTAANPTNFNLPSRGTVLVPAGQTSWPVSYSYHGGLSTDGHKILQVGISGVVAVGYRAVVGANQVARRVISEESGRVTQMVLSQGDEPVFMCSLRGGRVFCIGDNTYGQLGDGTTVSKTAPTQVVGGDVFTEISAGSKSVCGITSAGIVKCWGDNSYGQLGDSTTVSKSVPTPVDDASTYKSISVGNLHVCGVTTAGVAKCWGSNSSLGNGGATPLVPTAVTGGDLYNSVSAGAFTTCGILTSGLVKCWGDNEYGQIGDGTSGMWDDRAAPTAVSDSDTYSVVSVGYGHVCGVLVSGGIKCWGNNEYGQVGDGTTTSRIVPTPISDADTYVMVFSSRGKFYGWPDYNIYDQSCGVTSAGVVKCWGYSLGLVPEQKINGQFVSVVTGLSRHCAVDVNGVAQCWGAPSEIALGDALDGRLTSPVLNPTLTADTTLYDSISGSALNRCGISITGGELRCWGVRGGQEKDMSILMNAGDQYVKVAAGSSHSCGITSTGTAKCWGGGFAGKLGTFKTAEVRIPEPVFGNDTYTEIAVSYHHTCAVTSTGQAKCWGYNNTGELGNGNTSTVYGPQTVVGGDSFKAIAVSPGRSCGITTSDAIKCWGLGFYYFGNRLTPVEIAGGPYKAIAMGESAQHACGLTTAGKIWCWGNNDFGQLGDGTANSREEAVAVSGSETYKAVYVGGGTTCGLTTSGAALCWGAYVGDGTIISRTAPTAVTGGDVYTALSVSADYTCGVTDAGLVKCWGLNQKGQLGDGTTVDKYAPTAVLGADSYKAVSTGVVWSDADGNSTCALTVAGRVKCWGGSQKGLGVGNLRSAYQPIPMAL